MAMESQDLELQNYSIISQFNDFKNNLIKFCESEEPYSSYLLESNLNEAFHGLLYIQKYIQNKKLKILDVGAGSCFLALFLSSQGHNVSAVEPVSDGFPHFLNLINLSKKFASSNSLRFTHVNTIIENINENENYELIYSINAFEHIENWRKALLKCVNLIKLKGCFVLVCPNYSFIYEGHFEVPILFNKKITYISFRKRIEQAPFPDSIGLWKSLNWIKTKELITFSKSQKLIFTLKPSLTIVLERLIGDPIFRNRRGLYLGRLLSIIASFINKFYFINKLPIRYQPLIICIYTKL